MKLNSSESIAAAERVFRSYKGSWTAAREAAHRNAEGVLVIPTKSDHDDATGPAQELEGHERRKAG